MKTTNKLLTVALTGLLLTMAAQTAMATIITPPPEPFDGTWTVDCDYGLKFAVYTPVAGGVMFVGGENDPLQFAITAKTYPVYTPIYVLSDKEGEWITSDLGNISTVKAIQINYADQDASFLGKQNTIYHQYKLFYSKDGRKWELLVDKSKNKTDIPHDYIELSEPVEARIIKLENIHVPTGKFAISGLRVFGSGHGNKPDSVKNFTVLRTEKDKRSGWLKWTGVDNAQGYNIYMGIAPDKLYNCIMVYGANEYWLKAMDKEIPYYFSIEAFNENGRSSISKIIKSE